MRLIATLAGLALAALVQLAGAAAAPESIGSGDPDGRAVDSVHQVPARQRPRGDPRAGQAAADRRGQRLVPRRPGNEEPDDRLRAPVRAHDVPGLEARRAGDSRLRLLEGGRRRRRQRHDRTSTARTTSRPCPSNQLELALWLESDRMGYLLDALDQDDARQPAGRRAQRAPPDDREPALRHRRRGAVRARCSRRAIPTTPTVIGSHEDIQAAQLDDVRDFFKRYYAPEQRDARRSSATSTRERAGAGREVLRLASRAGRTCRSRQVVTPPIDGGAPR